ncbi:MAG TPA: hypothetical protein VK665_15485, partial [Candidatus Elarobacter sp.]|nr:hypothetical protein [Candidatus Elarobacter sp.]
MPLRFDVHRRCHPLKLIGVLGGVVDLTLFDAVATALGAPEIGPALEQTLALTSRSLALDAAWIWLIDESSGGFYLAA